MSIFKNNNINNPFGVPNTGNPDFPGFVEAYLSEEDAKRVAKLLGKKDKGNPSTPDIDLESAMSDEEKEILEAVEEERLDPLKRIISWAKKYNLGNENWVKENFEFNDDGTVICNTSLELNSMTKPDFPKSIKYVAGSLFLNGLTSAVGLNLPKKIEWNLSLNSLTSAEGLELPKEIAFNLYLNNLTSAKGLKFPNDIHHLSLNGLTSVEGLNLPKGIRNLYLNGLTSAVGLDLTNIKVWGFIYLEKVPNNEKQDLCEKYPNLRIV